MFLWRALKTKDIVAALTAATPKAAAKSETVKKPVPIKSAAKLAKSS